MTFRDTSLLWMLAAIPVVLLALTWRESVRTTGARLLVSERLRGVMNPARALRPWLLTLGMAGAVVAAAGPYVGYQTVPVTARESNRVIVFDLSHSMAAADTGTSRFDAGRFIVRNLARTHSGRIALIAFETRPELISPLTNDGEAVVSLLDSLRPGDLQAPGSDIGAAIELALRVATAERGQKSDIILISDGEDQGVRLATAVSEARTRGVAVSTISLGSSEGSRILSEGGSLVDENGQVVITRAHPEVLRDVARQTGGVFLENPAPDRVGSMLTGGVQQVSRSREVHVPIERFQWPLGLAFLAFIASSAVLRGAE